MQVAMIGLGKMGLNLAENMLDHGIEVYGYDIDEDTRLMAKEKGILIYSDLKKLVNDLVRPRIVWLMLPAGEITNSNLKAISDLVEKDDIIVDGGNSYYKDTVQNNKSLSKKGINFFDVGTSGGMSGARNNGNFMIGGDNQEAFLLLEPLFEKIALKDGYLYTGLSGSGHYLKNGP